MTDQDNKQITDTDATATVRRDLNAPEAGEIKGGPTPQNKRIVVLQSTLTGDSSGE